MMKPPKKKPQTKPKRSAATPAAAKAPRGRPARQKPLGNIGPDFVTKTPRDLVDAERKGNQLQVDHETHIALIDQQYGTNLPYDPLRLESEIRFYMSASAEAMLEAGRRLIQLKEHEEPGSFYTSLQRIGLADRTARQLMQAALKYSSGNRKALADLGKSKMFDLLVESDEDLDALAAGGTLRGLQLDDIEQMTVRELREALRASRAKVKSGEEVTERLLAGKDTTLNKLERELTQRKQRVAKWEGAYKEIAGNIHMMAGACMEGLVGLQMQIDAILKEAVDKNLSDEEITSIATPLFDYMTRVGEYYDEAAAKFDLNLMGRLPQHASKGLLAHKLILDNQSS